MQAYPSPTTQASPPRRLLDQGLDRLGVAKRTGETSQTGRNIRSGRLRAQAAKLEGVAIDDQDHV